MASMIFDAAQEQRPAVLEKSGAGVKNRVDRIRPIRRGQKRILNMPIEKR